MKKVPIETEGPHSVGGATTFIALFQTFLHYWCRKHLESILNQVCKRRKHNVLECKIPRKCSEQFWETMTSQRESLYGLEHTPLYEIEQMKRKRHSGDYWPNLPKTRLKVRFWDILGPYSDHEVYRVFDAISNIKILKCKQKVQILDHGLNTKHLTTSPVFLFWLFLAHFFQLNYFSTY